MTFEIRGKNEKNKMLCDEGYIINRISIMIITNNSNTKK